MRRVFPFFALLLLVRCTNSGMSSYDPGTGSHTSLMGNQGGAGVQAPIWSDDPSKKTLTNQGSSQ
jgi:hypothetical protein